MEFYLCRAMEVCRLTDDQLYRVYEREQKIKRLLMSHEIQKMLGLCSLKEEYEIPADLEAAQSQHAQRLRNEFRKAELLPKFGDLDTANLEACQRFDRKARQCNDEGKINLRFILTLARRKRSSDEM